jgi:hypothetical protein
MHIIENELSNIQLRQLAELLGVPKELIIFDHIRNLIDDLIRGVGIQEENVNYEVFVDISEKIKLNYSVLDVKIAEEEYSELNVTGTLKKIWGIIATFEPEQINSLKLRIKKEFNSINGTFKEKLDGLTVKYLDKYSSGNDDDYEYYTRALLIYCFEQCMIGEKTKKEKENN